MGEVLTEVDGDAGADNYQLTPYGLLLMKLENGAAARAACDALEAHMRKFGRSVVVDERLSFDDGPIQLEFAVLAKAVLWRDYTDPELKAKAAAELEAAVDAVRHEYWRRRREAA